MEAPAHPWTLGRWAKLLGGLAVLCLAGTYLAAQIDFVRRHVPGIPPRKYWWPQITQIWVPGLGATLVLSTLAYVVARRRRSSLGK